LTDGTTDTLFDKIVDEATAKRWCGHCQLRQEARRAAIETTAAVPAGGAWAPFDPFEGSSPGRMKGSV
jgi:hypothetical protein